MSFEAFVCYFQKGEVATVPSQHVREVFGAFLAEGGGYDWHLHYDDQNSCDLMLTKDPGDAGAIRGFTVMRPCGDVRLWDALAATLRFGNAALFFSSGAPLLVADSSVVQHLPEGMTEGSLGQPKCVTTGSEILHEMHECFKRPTA
jgi:hypothetical protein